MKQTSNPDFKNYLQSVCDHYRRWWTQYTLTDVRGKKQSELDDSKLYSPFDFGQTVKSISTKQPEAEQKQEKQEKIELLPVLEGITKYAPNHVLLTGKPGSGKSTALARLLLQKADTANSNLSFCGKAEVKIPVLLELRYYSSSVIDLIEDWFKRYQLLLKSSEIETLLFQKRFLLLVDGLNEVPSSEAIRDLKKFRLIYQATPMIFTTRQLDSGGNLGIEKLLEMQPLTETQSQKFVCAYLAKKSEQLLKQLGKRLREFGQTPLLLWMLCELFRQREYIPSNLGLIFRQFTQGYENHLKEDIPVETDRRQWQYLLQHLAFMMMQRQEPSDFRVAIPKQEAKQILRHFWQGKVTDPDSLAIKYLDDLLKYHLIQIGSSEQIEFRHQLLQEYYAAEFLLQKLDNLSHEEIKRDYLNYLKWTEPIALMLALVYKEEQAVQIVQLALEVDLNLAARLAGEVRLEFQEKTVCVIQKLQVPKLLKIKFLERTASEIAVPSLIQAMNHEDSVIFDRAVYALAKIGSDKVCTLLIQALLNDIYKDISYHQWFGRPKFSRVSFQISYTLGYIGSKVDVQSLIKALNDENSFVRSKVVEALGNIRSEAAIPELIKALDDEDSFVRSKVVEALGNIRSEAAIPELIKALDDEDFKVCEQAVEVLGNIRSEAAIPGLIKALVNRNSCAAACALGLTSRKSVYYSLAETSIEEDSKIRKQAIKVLRIIGSNLSVPELIKASIEKDSKVRKQAIKALRIIGSNLSVPELIKASIEKDSKVRKQAIKALRIIGSNLSVPELIKALDDEDFKVRKQAAETLIIIGSEKAVPSLITALNHQDSKVRGNVAYILSKIGSEKAVPSLITALNDEDFTVRGNAACALGRIGSEKAVPSLITALNDKKSDVRGNAVYALGRIGSEKAVPNLITALSDKNSLVRGNAGYALKTIGSEKAVPNLITALSDKNSLVRRNAAYVLEEIGEPRLLDYLWRLELDINTTYIGDVIEKIQARCQFYNYEIAQSHLLQLSQSSQNTRTMTENSSGTSFNFPKVKTVQVIQNNSGDVVAHKYAAEPKQNLAEVAKEIQQLLEQLAQTNPSIVESTQEEAVLVNIEREIKNNPTIKARLLAALKAGGTEALTQALETVFKNPLVNISVETVKGFIEA